MYKVEGESPHPHKLWYMNYSSRFLAGERLSQCKHTVHIAAPFFHSTVADFSYLYPAPYFIFSNSSDSDILCCVASFAHPPLTGI